MTTQQPERFGLWAVLTNLDWKGNEEGRVMARLGSYSSYDAAYWAWALADKRMRRGRKSIRRRHDIHRDHMLGGPQRLEYLAVRSESDPVWPMRYPNVNPGRWTALLTANGSRVSVRIYGNTYTGTVVSMRDLTGEVRFSTGEGPRVRGFTLLPVSPFARGIHSVIQR